MTLRRIQVLLEPRQDDELAQLARVRGISKSELLRRAVDQMLSEEHPLAPDDPFLGLLGASASGLGDLSERHDEYLADAEVGEWHRTT